MTASLQVMSPMILGGIVKRSHSWTFGPSEEDENVVALRRSCVPARPLGERGRSPYEDWSAYFQRSLAMAFGLDAATRTIAASSCHGLRLLPQG